MRRIGEHAVVIGGSLGGLLAARALSDAYERVTGEDIPADDSDLSGDPRGESWDDEAALSERYPRLAERFR